MEDGKPVVSAMRRIEGSNIEMEKFYSKEVVITELEKDKVKVENLNELVNRRKDEYLAKTGRIWIDV